MRAAAKEEADIVRNDPVPSASRDDAHSSEPFRFEIVWLAGEDAMEDPTTEGENLVADCFCSFRARRDENVRMGWMAIGNFVDPEGERCGDRVGMVVWTHGRRRSRNSYLEENFSADLRVDRESMEYSDDYSVVDIDGEGVSVVGTEGRIPRMACDNRGVDNIWHDPSVPRPSLGTVADVVVVAPPKKNSWKLVD